MADTTIEYLTKTWNPIQTVIKGKSGQGWHCTPVSKGCTHCWAEGMNNRFGNKLPYDNKHMQLEIKENELKKPFTWRKPQVVGVQYMSDLFHEDVTYDLILKVINVALLNPKHTFVILTKRLDAAIAFHTWIKESHIYQANEYPKNILFGCSVEDQVSADHRIPKLLLLKELFPNIRLWLSVEPLINEIKLQPVWLGNYQSCDGFYPRQMDLVVVGGESGKGARPMHPDWVRNIRDDCKAAGVMFLFKQWGEYISSDKRGKNNNWLFQNGRYMTTSRNFLVLEQDSYFLNPKVIAVKIGKKNAGRLLDGIEHNEFPKDCGEK